MSARTSSPTRIGGAVILVAVIAVVSASACLDRKLQPLNPCLVQGVADEINVDTVDKVDLLFVVDDSISMRQEQTALAQNFPLMAETLASGDRDGDGEEDFPPVQDLHLGVVSTNMGGYGSNTQGGCSHDSNLGNPKYLGDDGLLQTGVGEGVDNPGMCPDVSTSGGPFLAFQGNQDPTAFGRKFGCVAQLGSGGCGFEQQLEAPLKALTPSTANTSFFEGAGHGDQANQGFVREDSLLAVILVTDEDDCSVQRPALYSGDAGAPYNQISQLDLRCAAAIGLQRLNGQTIKFETDPPTLTPIGRYINGYLNLRPGNSDRFIFGAITGIPQNLEEMNASYDEILQAPSMQLRERPDNQRPMNGLPIHPSCTGMGSGANAESVPPRRIVRVAQGIENNGGNSVVTSICRQDFSRALQNIINKISEQLQTPCLPRELTRTSDGTVDCRVVEILPAEGENSQCSQIPGRTGIPGRMQENREVCRVEQIAIEDPNNPTQPPADPPGWYYDDFSSGVIDSCGQDGQRIAFTTGDEPRSGTTVELECFQTVDSSASQQCTVNSPCSCGGGSCTSDRFDGNLFQCDNRQAMGVTASRTCQIACNTNADCLEQNLGGYVCDTRDASQTPLGPPPGNFEGWCVAPTCQSTAPGEGSGSGGGGGNMGGGGR